MDAAENAQSQSQLRRFFHHPLVNTALSIIGGFLLGLFSTPTPSPDISFYVDPIRSPLVQAGKNSDLSVLYKGETVTANVTSVTLSIWNRGSRAVHAAEVEEPIQIVTSNRERILDAKILHVSRPLTGIALDRRNLGSGLLAFQFRILEPNDGAQIQLIYEGAPDVSIQAKGVVEGQSAISFVSTHQRPAQPADRASAGKVDLYVAIIFSLIMALGFVMSVIDACRARTRLRRWREIGMAIFALALIAYILGGAVYPRLVAPPTFTGPPPPEAIADSHTKASGILTP